MSTRELNRFERTLAAVTSLALAGIAVKLTLAFLPSRAEAQATGRLAPWLILWGLTWVGVLSGVAVGAFLLSKQPNQPRRD